MTVDEMFPKRENHMVHTAAVVRADMFMSKYNIKGVVDRRYKSGYRVKPENGYYITIDFHVQRSDWFRIRAIVNIGKPKTEYDFGRYMVVELTPETVKLIPCSLVQNKNRPHLVIPDKLELFFYGFTVSEGSQA